MKRREFSGGAAVTWPIVAHAQQPAMLVVGFLHSAALKGSAFYVTAFRNGLKSGHAARTDECPLSGVKRKSLGHIAMSR